RDDLVTGVQTCALPISGSEAEGGMMTTATQQAIGADRRSADRGEDSYAEAHGRAGNGSGGRGPLHDSERLARRLGWFSIGLGLRSEERRVGKECRCREP